MPSIYIIIIILSVNAVNRRTLKFDSSLIDVRYWQMLCVCVCVNIGFGDEWEWSCMIYHGVIR